MMYIQKRRPVTLLELIVVIAIIATLSAVVAISVNKALVEQRFKTEVGKIVDELRLAQDLMLVLGRDVHVKFAVQKGGDGIEYWIDHETALSGHVQKELSGRKRLLSTIKGVFLEDELLQEVKQGEIDVKFFSKGAVMSKGVMRLATTDKEPAPEGTIQSYICLSGYPQTIVSSDTLEDAQKRCTIDTPEEREKLTRDTIERLPEKVKKKNAPSGEKNQEGKDGKEGEKEIKPLSDKNQAGK